MKKLKVDKSKIAGKGLFTTDVFKKGEMIGLAHENDQPTTSIGKNHNHSDNPNAVSIKLGNKRYLMAKRPLKKGEEITTNYRLQPELEQPEDFAKGGTVIPLVEDAGLMNEDGFWVPDWETIAMQAKQLGAKTVKTKSGVIIYFDDNWKVQSVDENPQMKKGGTPKSLVKMPKPSKQGLASKKFSKSLEATNRLFTENRLFAKPKSRKRKVFDPGANYQDGGTTTPEDYAQFQTFAQTLPSNLQDSNFEYGNPDQYDLYGMWETVGKPGSFADVQDSEYFPLDEDGTYHGFTVGADGTFLKPMSHNTTWKEVMNSQLSLDPYFQENRLIRNEQGRLQYIPKAEYGMPLGAGMSQNYQGRRKFIHQDGGITSQEEIDAGNNAMMKARLAYAYMHGNPAAQRMVVAPDQPYVFDDGNTGTHFMASMDNYAVPLIQDVNGQLMLGDFGPESAEAIRFDNPEDAMYFAENYKQITPDESYRKENPEEDYIEAELTEEEIEEYRKGGFIVEELDTYPKGGGPGKGKKDKFKNVQPFVTSNPSEYAYRKAAYNDSLNLYRLDKEAHDANYKSALTRWMAFTQPTSKNIKKARQATDTMYAADQRLKDYNRISNVKNDPIEATKSYAFGRDSGGLLKGSGLDLIKKKGKYVFVRDDSKSFTRPVQPVQFKKPESEVHQYATEYKPVVNNIPPGISKSQLEKAGVIIGDKAIVGYEEVQQLDPTTGVVTTVINPVYRDLEKPIPTLTPTRVDPRLIEFTGNPESEMETDEFSTYPTPDGGADWVGRTERYVDWNGNKIPYRLPRFRKPGHGGDLIRQGKKRYIPLPSIESRYQAEIVPEEEYADGGERKKRKKDSKERYRSEDGNVRTPITPEMQAEMSPEEWGQYVQEVPEVYTTRTREQQDIRNALDYQQRMAELYPGRPTQSDAIQPADWFWQLGMLGPAGGISKSAVQAAEAAGSRALPYITGALETSIPGMASIPGATVGNALGAIAAVDSGRRLLDVPSQVQKGEYADAAANVLTGALDIGTAGIISPLYKGAKATATELKAALEAKNPANFKIPEQSYKKKLYDLRDKGTGSYKLVEIDVPQEVIPGRSYDDVKHKLKNLRSDLNISPTEHYLSRIFGRSPIGMSRDRIIADPRDGRLFDSNTRYWLNRLYGNTPSGPEVVSENLLAKDYGKLYKEGLSFEEAQDIMKKYNDPIDYQEVPRELPGSPNALKSSLGSIDMSKYEIKNPDYFTKLLDTYDSRKLSPTNKNFYKGLIESVKKQNGIATERQYNELQRLRTGNFNFGKKGYSDGGIIMELSDAEIKEYKKGGWIIEEM